MTPVLVGGYHNFAHLYSVHVHIILAAYILGGILLVPIEGAQRVISLQLSAREGALSGSSMPCATCGVPCAHADDVNDVSLVSHYELLRLK